MIRQLKSGKWNVQFWLAGKPARSHTVHSRREPEGWALEQELSSKFVHHRLAWAGEDYWPKFCNAVNGCIRRQLCRRFSRLCLNKPCKDWRAISRARVYLIFSYNTDSLEKGYWQKLPKFLCFQDIVWEKWCPCGCNSKGVQFWVG